MLTLILAIRAYSRNRRVAREMNGSLSCLDSEIAELSRDLDTLSRQSGEQAKRIAWLESRLHSVPEESETLAEMVSTTAKPTITERRHRVLSLSRRGQDSETIARTLGMLQGEVELMISLGQAA